MKVINPATERVIKNIPTDNLRSIQEKYQLAIEAQRSFVLKDLSERLSIVEDFSSLLLKQESKLANLLTSEMGKPITQSVNEIRAARLRIAFF